MRINSSMTSFYDAGRVNSAGHSGKTERVEKIRPVEETKGISSLTEQLKAEERSRENLGVVQTKVSPDNAFQKAMVTDRSFAFDRMAGKLMDKLPDILKDMARLPEENAFAGILEEKQTAAAPKKVVISEDGRVSGQPAAAPEQEDISL